MTLSMKPFFLILALLTFSTTSWAESEDPAAAQAETGYRYFSLTPDITTNFHTNGDDLGFVRVSVDLMIENPADVSIVEHNVPLIRDAIIEVLTEQNEAQIKSIAGREAIRLACLQKVNELLLAEANKKVVTELLFTKYLYQ
ncbi:hypothetical protein VST7929_00111 [Vibrio stylophorae]|uniref:Flagellar protein FliL n=1 Tax=Vibrio stylophorae TaxID=659351 RepID=A0ABN8DNP2_9VIBR|nr:flagellar basal body-associated protein FliL [Vibrio stylophorae]CAH0532295.1 hypothetical protein VST7929_00111 [Vibrio stylophorae]